MNLRYALAAATTAAFLTAGGVAQAQQTMPDTGTGTKTMPAERQSTPMHPGASSSMKSGTLNTGSLREVKDDREKVMARSLGVNGKDLADMDIYGADGKKIGEVDKVLADHSEDIKAVTVDVGGFLGVGGKEVLISLDNLRKGTKKDQLQTTMTKKQIETLSEWKDHEKTAPMSK